MRSTLILMLVCSQIVFAEEGKWKAMPFTLGGIGGLPQERDICLRVVINPEQGELGYGPILLWKAKSQDEFLQITNSLSALSKAINVVVEGMPEVDQRIVIKNAVGNYCRAIRAVILVGEERERVLMELVKFAPEKAAELIRIAPDIVEQWEQDRWRLTFFILSEGGAVEKHTFRGKRVPLAIKQHDTELVAEEGSIPWGRAKK